MHLFLDQLIIELKYYTEFTLPPAKKSFIANHSNHEGLDW